MCLRKFRCYGRIGRSIFNCDTPFNWSFSTSWSAWEAITVRPTLWFLRGPARASNSQPGHNSQPISIWGLAWKTNGRNLQKVHICGNLVAIWDTRSLHEIPDFSNCKPTSELFVCLRCFGNPARLRYTHNCSPKSANNQTRFPSMGFTSWTSSRCFSMSHNWGQIDAHN
jgi:hypothetical protein